MKKPKLIYYVNGKFVTSDKASISVLDIGFLRGYGVFDFLVTYGGRPFLLDEHVDRLFESAKLIDLKIGKTKKQVKDIVLKTLKKNDDSWEKSIRIVVTGGVGNSSFEPSLHSNIIVTVDNKHIYPKEFYKYGVSVITFDYVRPVALAKSLDYTIAIKALQLAKKQKAIEAFYIDPDTSTLSEATTCNVFIVKNGKIYTPKSNILEGVTRNHVIKILKNPSPVSEKQISRKELFEADEVFITASNKEVMPIIKIDNKKVGNGKVGAVTKNVMNLYRNFVESRNW